jgi:hypothetical protein
VRARPRVRRNRMKRDPYTTEKRSPIEILSRLAGRTNFITPRQGGMSRTPITDLDIAAAIASAHDKLGSSMAMAIACQRPQEWDHVHERGLPRFNGELRAQREMPGIIDGAFKFRARIALYDGFRDLVAPAKRTPLRAAARAWHMGERVYAFLHRRATAMLEAAANTAAADATRFLFAEYVERAEIKESVLVRVGDDGDIQIITERRARLENQRGATDEADDLIDLLLSEESTRRRLPGVLTLNGCADIALVTPRA